MKRQLTFIAIMLTTLTAFAFDWPQAEVTKNSFNSYFGQNRGGILSTSIIFSEPEEVKAAENGYITAIITENSDDSDFFPSTLGTAVIIAHNDELVSVYGNLDAETLTLKNENEHTIDAGATIGSSGNSGFQENHGNLEFKIIDAKNKSAINPIVLMPRAQEEIPLSLSGIIIVSKNNDYYDINTYKTYASGLYKVYFKRNPVAAPYKTSVSINGVIVDQLSYDMITQENNKLCIIGKKKYTDADIFPNEDLQLLGEAMFTPGRVTLGLSISDMLGNVKQLNYNIVIR